MIQTLSDVLDNRDALVAQLEESGKDREGDSSLFSSARMDGIVVLDDLIMKRYFEHIYTFNTHLAPRCLPGMGLAVGDIIDHAGDEYLALSLGVMLANVMALHAIREKEPLYVEWDQKREEMNRRVRLFTEEVCAFQAGCCGIKEFSEFEELGSFVGWFDSLTPSPVFIETLQNFSAMMNRRRQQGMRPLARMASELARELAPYSVFQELLKKIRKDTGHKGFPYVNEGMLHFPTPAASGGVTLHNYSPHDDFAHAMPGFNDLFIVAIQAGLTPIVFHIGEGNRPGQHYFMLPPRTPFFPLAQEKIDADPGLNELWDQVVHTDGAEDLEKKAAQWLTTTLEAKHQVIKDVVPHIISERVLGWHVNMMAEKGVALMRPVVAETHFEKVRQAVEEHGLEIIRPNFKALLIGTRSGGYGEGQSVFPSPETSGHPSASAQSQ